MTPEHSLRMDSKSGAIHLSPGGRMSGIVSRTESCSSSISRERLTGFEVPAFRLDIVKLSAKTS